MAGIACRDVATLADHRFEIGEAFGSGLRAIAFVFFQGNLDHGGLAGFFVDQLFVGVQRHDFVFKAARCLCRRGALLALQAVFVLALARNLVALRDDFRCLDHRVIQLRLVALDPLFVRMPIVLVIVLHHADGFQSACDHDRHAINNHAMGRHGNGLQARATEAVDGDRGGGHRQAAANRRLARNVVAGGAFRVSAADDDIFDFLRFDTGALNGMFDDMATELGAVGQVEGATIGFTDRCAGGGYDHCFSHF